MQRLKETTKKGWIRGNVHTAHLRHTIALHLWACCKKEFFIFNHYYYTKQANTKAKLRF